MFFTTEFTEVTEETVIWGKKVPEKAARAFNTGYTERPLKARTTGLHRVKPKAGE